MPERPVNRRDPVRLADIVDDLLWPHLLTSVRLALRPAPIALGLLLTLLVIAIGDLGAIWGEGGWLELVLGRAFDNLGLLVAAAGAADQDLAVRAIHGLVFALPAAAFDEHPISTIVLPLPMLVITCIFMGAISRIAAVEYAQGAFLRAREAVGFALPRIASLTGAQLGPWIAVWLMVLAMAAGGWVLFSLPTVSTLGVILYPLFLLGAFLCVIIVLTSLVGCPMFIPAVACEGVDGLDAVQRVFSLVLANPLRLLLYLGILGMLGAGAIFVASVVVEGSLALAAGAATAWSGDQGAAILASTAAPEEPDGWFISLFSSDPTAPRSIAGVWTGAFGLLVSAFLVSWYASASTMLFLVMRQAGTGQERTEIWSPGMVEASMTEALTARAAARPETGEHAAERLGEHERHADD